MAAVTVACVCRSGGEYGQREVDILRKGVEDNLATDFDFVVLDDDNLRHKWPGWWSKIELFRPGLFTGRVLYLDLDNVVVGDLSPLLDTRGTVFMRDFFLHGISSSVMCWDAGALDVVYKQFATDPHDAMQSKHKVNPRQAVYGDQSWLERCVRRFGLPHRFFQDVTPYRVIKWNKGGLRKPRGASVAVFMATNKPWTVHGWASAIWRQYGASRHQVRR